VTLSIFDGLNVINVPFAKKKKSFARMQKLAQKKLVQGDVIDIAIPIA
jgi:hypothetical protein